MFPFTTVNLTFGIFSKDVSISEPHQPKETVSMACGLRVTPETALPSSEKEMVGIGNDYNHL
jgi:hypothetical protein